MKKNTHPKYQKVLFVDSSTGQKFVCGSTLQPKQTEKFEGKEYPVCYVAVSSYSHPLFTGSKQFVDAEGRVDKFQKKYAQKNKKEPSESKTSSK
jgi:large subunit ribosomal protein L31